MNNTINIDIAHVAPAISVDAVKALAPEALKAQKTVEQGTGAGNDFLGWVKLPSTLSEELISDIEATAASLQKDCEYVV